MNFEVENLKDLFVFHEGLYYPILEVDEIYKFINIKRKNMPIVFQHAAKIGTSGRFFGSVTLTEEDLTEAQNKLEKVRQVELEESLRENELVAKIKAALDKLGLY